MGLLEDFEQGIGAFGPFALHSEKKFARAVGPALAGVLGQQVNASGQLSGDIVRTGGMTEAADMREQGETFRQRLLNDAQILLRDMMEKGATQREGMQQGGATYRTKLGEEGAMGRLKKQALLRENAFDKILMNENYMSRQSNYDRLASPGGVGRTVDSIEGDRKKKDEYSGYGGFGSLNPWFGVEDYGE